VTVRYQRGGLAAVSPASRATHQAQEQFGMPGCGG
jgi:hypothetical protein